MQKRKKHDIRQTPTRGLSAVTATLVAAAAAASLLSGCSGGEGKKKELSFEEAIAGVTSVETSVQLDVQGTATSNSGSHNASIGTDMTTVYVLGDSPAYHMESYSKITVDGVGSRDDEEMYVLQEGSNFVSYEYVSSSDEWKKQVLSRAEAAAISTKTGFVDQFPKLLESLSVDGTEDLADGSQRTIYKGDVDRSYLQYFFGNNKVFGSFMTSVEHLLKDSIPCELAVSSTNMLPDYIEFDFTDSWKKSDMDFDNATVTVHYSNWNKESEIELPKKVSVVATNPDEEFYETYYAWNLFLPYVGGSSTGSGSAGNSGQSFTSSWETYQLRIDGGMTSLPLSVQDLQKVGYTIDSLFESQLIEPNQYVEGIVLNKNQDKMKITVYNPDTVAQPVASCNVGAIDLYAADIPQNGIVVYFPGEVTLGMTGESLISAYGEPDEKISSFSSDHYKWYGEGDLQFFESEVSPVTGQVIRLKLSNIPVSGGEQNAQPTEQAETSGETEAGDAADEANSEASE